MDISLTENMQISEPTKITVLYSLLCSYKSPRDLPSKLYQSSFHIEHLLQQSLVLPEITLSHYDH